MASCRLTGATLGALAPRFCIPSGGLSTTSAPSSGIPRSIRLRAVKCGAGSNQEDAVSKFRLNAGSRFSSACVAAVVRKQARQGNPRDSFAASSKSMLQPAFGYTRKDVLLIGAGITVFGFALKAGLELAGLDTLKAGNVVQLVMVLGLSVGWVYSYVFRVSNKDMTYIKQLKDYEMKVMEKRYQELPEAELETLLAQVEEEKERLRQRRAKRNTTSS